MRCCFSKCCSNVVQMMLFVEIYKISIQINLKIWNQKSYSESEEVSSVMAGREIIIINIQLLSPKSFRQFTNRMELLVKTFIDCGTGYQMFTHSFIGGEIFTSLRSDISLRKEFNSRQRFLRWTVRPVTQFIITNLADSSG